MRSSTIILAIWLLLSGCSSHPARLTPSGLNSTFAFDSGQPFSTYIDHYRTIILASRTDLDGTNREAVLAANLPFELKPEKTAFSPGTDGRYHKGIILIHGLSDSPYLMKTLGEHFRSRGFLVRALLLPGHGTRPGDLTRVTEEDWRRALDYVVKDTCRQVEQLYLAGFSTGGALAVDYAISNPDTLAALFLFSPCLQVKSSAARWAGFFGLFRTWLEINDDRDYAKYESFPINAAVQIVTLTDRIRAAAGQNQQSLALPVFLALSEEDETVDSAFSLTFFRKHLINPASRLLLYSGERTPPAFQDPRITTVSSFLPGRKILNMSHLALTLPAEDPHYGVQGDYRSCLHYPSASVEFSECSAGRAKWLGERTPANLRTGLLQRLTWNPRYTLQSDEIDRFIGAMEPPPTTTAVQESGSTPTPAARCVCSSGL